MLLFFYSSSSSRRFQAEHVRVLKKNKNPVELSPSRKRQGERGKTPFWGGPPPRSNVD